MNDLSPAHIKTIRQLREREFRESSGFFWAEGERTIVTLLEKKLALEFGVFTESHPKAASLFPPGSSLFFCRESNVNKIKSTETFPGLGAVFQKPTPLPLQGDTLIALDGIQDPGNLGTIFRTALWFGFPHLLLDRKSADPFHEKVVRASMGAVASVHAHVEKDLASALQSLKTKGYKLVGADLSGAPLSGVPAGKKVLVMGNEANGISKAILELCDRKIRISGSGEAESLNVSVAAGILLHELSKNKAQTEA